MPDPPAILSPFLPELRHATSFTVEPVLLASERTVGAAGDAACRADSVRGAGGLHQLLLGTGCQLAQASDVLQAQLPLLLFLLYLGRL